MIEGDIKAGSDRERRNATSHILAFSSNIIRNTVNVEIYILHIFAHFAQGYRCAKI